MNELDINLNRNINLLMHYANMRKLITGLYDVSLSPTNKQLLKDVLEVLDLSAELAIGDSNQDENCINEIYEILS